MNDFQKEIRFALSHSNLQIKTQFHINVPENTRDGAHYSGYLLFRKEAVWELKNEQLWNNGCLHFGPQLLNLFINDFPTDGREATRFKKSKQNKKQLLFERPIS